MPPLSVFWIFRSFIVYEYPPNLLTFIFFPSYKFCSKNFSEIFSTLRARWGPKIRGFRDFRNFSNFFRRASKFFEKRYICRKSYFFRAACRILAHFGQICRSDCSKTNDMSKIKFFKNRGPLTFRSPK